MPFLNCCHSEQLARDTVGSDQRWGSFGGTRRTGRDWVSTYLLWCLLASRGHQYATAAERRPWVRRESCSTYNRERSREKTRGWHYSSICFHWYHPKLKPNSWEMLIWQAFGSTAGGNLSWNSPFGTLSKPWRTHGLMDPPFQSWAPTQQKCPPGDTQEGTFKRALRIISPN